MRIPEIITDNTQDLIHSARALLDGVTTSTLRLGVTGLSRSGKTVFITALVNALTDASATPPLIHIASLPNLQAYLEPQPDDDVPRFAYEDHRAALTDGTNRTWPDSTRHISQLRVTLEWDGESGTAGWLGMKRRLHIDIVDYPGEWLLDLALLNQSYQNWSEATLQVLRTRHADAATKFLKFVDELQAPSSVTESSEQVAIDGSKLFTDCLHAVRADANTQAVLGPGRFLWPGDLTGAPQVTFLPLPLAATKEAEDQLVNLLARRFEAYKTNVVKPFFRDHFQRLDRQIVLVDALTPLNRGALALRDLEDALENVLSAFRPGANSWLSYLTGRRIDRILFAATKADHIHGREHHQLEVILDKVISRVSRHADKSGAETHTVAVASVRATDDVMTQTTDEVYHCIRGTPAEGEQIDGKRYDGKTQAVIFPGDLPKNALDVLDPDFTGRGDYDFVRFRPPVLHSDDEQDKKPRWPHIGLDKALAFLIGDHLT